MATLEETNSRAIIPRYGSVARALSVTLRSEVAAAAAAFAAVGTLGAENGGYFATTWGWVAVPLFAFVALVLVFAPRRGLEPIEVVLLAAIIGLCGWIFLSALWSQSVTRSILEGERSLVYVAAVAAGLLVTRRAGGRGLLIGTWLAIVGVSVYALLTRLFPRQFGYFDSIAGYQLSAPVGYWNGLAILTAMGILVALGLAARGSVLVRVGAAASTTILFPTLYFTFSRGGWIALITGGAVAVALERRRLQLTTTALFLAPWAAIGIWYASRAKALTHTDAPLAAAASDGHALAVILVGLMTLAALTALVLDLLEANVRVRPGLQRFYAGTLLFVLAAALIVAFGRYGSPVTIARDSWSSFKTSTPAGTNLNSRLFHLSGSGRIDHWRVALDDRAAHPWLGSGAGTYGEYWFQHRPSTVIVHDTHSLYLETLAELGPVGLGLLVLLLGAPLVVAVRRRSSPFSAVAVGAYVAFLIHAAVDWDWELPVIVVAALLCLLAVLGEPRRRESPDPAPARWRTRLALVGAAVVLGGFSLFGLLGNLALATSGHAADGGNWKQAASEARQATDLAPWSGEAWRKLGVAQAGPGDLRAARKSFLQAVRLEPDDWSLWFQLGRVSAGAERRRADAMAHRLNPSRAADEASFAAVGSVVAP